MDNQSVASESLVETHAFLLMRNATSARVEHHAAPTRTVPVITVALKTMNVIVETLPLEIVQQVAVEIAAGTRGVADTTDFHS